MKSFNELAADLAKPGADIVAEMTPQKAHLLHMASCISGEAGELIHAHMLQDWENAVEEIGDIKFYIAGLLNGLGWPDFLARIDTPKGSALEYVTKIAVDGANVFDIVKKHCFYDEHLDLPKLSIALQELVESIAKYEHVSMIMPKESLEKINQKLGKRYASGSFSNAQAQERADKGPQMTGSDLKTARN